MLKYLSTLAILTIATPAISQVQCADYKHIVNGLTNKYNEARQTMGIASTGQAVEMWANDETGSWTFIVINPTGRTCIGAHGENFETVPVDKGQKL